VSRDGDRELPVSMPRLLGGKAARNSCFANRAPIRRPPAHLCSTMPIEGDMICFLPDNVFVKLHRQPFIETSNLAPLLHDEKQLRARGL